MNTLRDAAQQALDVLERGVFFKPGWIPDRESAITALRAALLTEPHPGDFGIPQEHRQAAQAYANWWHENRQKAQRPAPQPHEVERLQAERDALQATLDDYMDDHKAVVNEQCAGDEIHCSCVPHLRKRIKEVEAERDALLAAAELMTAAIDAARGKP